MNWREVSEVVVGKMLVDGHPRPEMVDPTIVYPPYDRIVEMLRAGAEDIDIADEIGFSALRDCEEMASSVNGNTLDFLELLDRTAMRAEVSKALSPLVKKLDRGETIDVSKGLAALGRLEREQRVFVPMSQVEPEDVIWHPTFYPPIDEYVGGIPDSGLIVVGGPPGTGKTTFLAKLLINMAKNQKKTAFFSLEMTMNQVMFRALQIDPKFKTKKVQENLLIADDVFTVDEIYSHASRLKAAHPDLYMIGVDFADMIAPAGRGKEGVEAVDSIYKTLARLAKKIRTPVMVLSQLNYNYVGGRPRVNHLRGSRLIEALGALVLLLWNPEMIDVEQKDEVLQIHPGVGYIIVGKSRFGFHNPTQTVGAIQVDFKKEKGWADKANGWFSLGSA